MTTKVAAGVRLSGETAKASTCTSAQSSGRILLAGPTVAAGYLGDPTRTRKLLLHRSELDKLVGAVERKGYTLVPTAMYWKQGRAKIEIALARGKKEHDKRATEKERDWQREKAGLMKKPR